MFSAQKRPENTRKLPLLAALLPALVILTGCPDPPGGIRISGKVVAEGMAVEGAVIEIFRDGDPTGRPLLTTGSGYHGSFTVKVPPGRYLLRARHVFRLQRGSLSLAGETTVRVPADMKRVDRVVIELGRSE